MATSPKERISVSDNVVAVGPFYDTNVDASQTNVQLAIVGAGNAGWIAPCAGSVVALAWKLSAAGSAGALSIGATVGGTEDTDTTQAITTAASGYAQFDRNAVRFAAGAELGVEITTDGSWNGTTADLDVSLFVLLENMTF